MNPSDFQLLEELRKNEFRVTIFGSARIQKDDPIYKDTFELARKIGEDGLDLVTGGGPGIMEAGSLGHTAGDKEKKAHSIGLNIRLPFEQKPNDGLEWIENHERFSTRLDEFMMLSNVIVVMPGGIGTCLEFFYSWQLVQVKHMCKTPIILVGDMWRKLLDWVIDHPLRDGYLDSEDLNTVVWVHSGEKAWHVIQKAKEHFDQNGQNECQNWQKYGEKFWKE